jgi:hypothetical protein
MGTGSDHGAPGEHLPEPPLSEDEQRMLDELKRPVDGEPIEAVEDTPAAVESAEGETSLPADVGGADDPGTPDAPEFRAPR